MKKMLSLFSLMIFQTGLTWAGCPMMGAMKSAGPMSGCCPSRGLSIALYLALLALGYWVLRHAEKEEQRLLKTVGRVVAGLILVISLFGVLCKTMTTICSSKCPISAKMQPMSHEGDTSAMPDMPPPPAQ
ncbi:MAG TPA: hypothetical protein PK876_02115 [Elusimicrobiota bacterium]|nr:hypothetical protein [Elusimicrobiota bacterium]